MVREGLSEIGGITFIVFMYLQSLHTSLSAVFFLAVSADVGRVENRSEHPGSEHPLFWTPWIIEYTLSATVREGLSEISGITFIVFMYLQSLHTSFSAVFFLTVSADDGRVDHRSERPGSGHSGTGEGSDRWGPRAGRLVGV